jgi:hypothetical protein
MSSSVAKDIELAWKRMIQTDDGYILDGRRIVFPSMDKKYPLTELIGATIVDVFPKCHCFMAVQSEKTYHVEANDNDGMIIDSVVFDADTGVI